MANRRMFSKEIIDSDAFLDMPQSTQCLYFHLSMRADDDGFINNPKKIMRMVGCGEDDIKVLLTKRFVLSFESGVIVIKHWRMHNYIKADRYKPTAYQEELKSLQIKKNGAYTEVENVQDFHVSKVDTQVRLGKVRLGKGRVGEAEAKRTHAGDEEGKDTSHTSLPFYQKAKAAYDSAGHTFDFDAFYQHYESQDWRTASGKDIRPYLAERMKKWQEKQPPELADIQYKECPSCGKPVIAGGTICNFCRHDFGAPTFDEKGNVV